MAARQIPSRVKGLQPAGIGAHGLRRYFDRNSPAKRKGLRRGDLKSNGPVSVRVSIFHPACSRRLRMIPAERHISVLGREAVQWLAPRAGGIYVDATFGAGGYSRAILDIAGTRVIGIDRDRTAI